MCFEEICTGFCFYSEDSDLREFFHFESGELMVEGKEGQILSTRDKVELAEVV